MTVKKIEDERKAKSAAWHKEWRKKNPERQKAIMDRFYAKKAAKYLEDLSKTQAELKV